MPATKKQFTISEAAKKLRISRQAVHEAIKKRIAPRLSVPARELIHPVFYCYFTGIDSVEMQRDPKYSELILPK